MLTKDQRWIADAFEAELCTIKFSQPTPMWVVDRRLALGDMVLTEIPGDDPEELAIRAEAEALWALCFSPGDRDVITRYLSTRRAHVELLQATWPGLS